MTIALPAPTVYESWGQRVVFGPFKFVPMIPSQSSGSVSAIGFTLMIPALFTRT